MKQLFIAMILITGMSLSACVQSEKDGDLKQAIEELEQSLNEVHYTKVAIDSIGISLQLPDGMKRTSVLDPNAPIQFEEGKKERYLIGIYEDYQDANDALELLGFDQKNKSFLENYLDFTENSMKQAVSVSKIGNRTSQFIDGNEALSLQVDGTVEGVIFPISYFITIIETKNRVYKFITWTILSKKDEFKEIDANIMKSIHFR